MDNENSIIQYSYLYFEPYKEIDMLKFQFTNFIYT